MPRLAVSVAALVGWAGAAFAGPVPPAAAPAPGVLIAQVDDSDLKDEETLNELMVEEYDKDAWSMGSAIGLSLIPGAGYGLVYAEKKAQSVVPFLVSAVGYGLGAAYLLGVFDETSKQVCLHVRDGKVPLDECEIGGRAGDNQQIDGRSEDMNTPYFATKADYTRGVQGEDFDGKDTGVLILGATYAATTILGAVWAAMTVADHNDRLKKDIESTAQAPSPTFRPVIGGDRSGGLMGFAVDF
ncbi:MAG: hypothetical protein H6706_07495 [Myxococcales bacterium]|nr:hypothetical protein [Myxococcales bacterium]